MDINDQLLQQHYFSQQQNNPVRLLNPTSYHVQQTYGKSADPMIGLGDDDDTPIKQEMDSMLDPIDPFNTLVDEFGSSISTQAYGGLGQHGNLLQHPQHLTPRLADSMLANNLLSPTSSSPLDPDDLDGLVDDYTPHNSGSLTNSPYSSTPANNTNHNDVKPTRKGKSTRSSMAAAATMSSGSAPTGQVGQHMYSYSLPSSTSGATRHPPPTLPGGHPSSFGAFGSGTRQSGVSDFASVAGTSYDSDTSKPTGAGGRVDANEKRRRRRESHNAVERRRRDNINEKIQELATLLPEYSSLHSDGTTKPNKGVILRRSVEYMRHIQGVAYRIAERNQELEEVLKRICTEAGIPESSLGLSMPLGTELFDIGMPNPNQPMNMDD
ncbi:hypothetical protein SmJEL517_g05645 [Synchytrium microbalum]|uniref:BHLH domain-containing protein n=1 Tax=Synchytrium microbalum TaxID=1806994 RepID=A0A507BTG6_9FUNG|nr:uncharacterized protein SmJEL517_g05645 [Synchytrium microbalum]TPX30902.1 hypothetical protein SmJEL517_g05645 [Synchytrium microbalum]